MSDPFLTLKFAQSLGQQQSPLSKLGQGIGQVGQAFQTRELESRYDQALNTAMTNPTNENISQLYQIAEPLGRFPNARAAINDLFARMPQDSAVAPDGTPIDPNMGIYDQAFEAWRADPMNEDLKNDLLRASMAVDLFSETQKTVEETVGTRTEDQSWNAYQSAQEAYKQNPSYNNEIAVVNAATKVGGDAASNIRQVLSDIDSRRTDTELRAIETRRWAAFE